MRLPLHCPACNAKLEVDLDALSPSVPVRCACGRERPSDPMIALRDFLREPATASMTSEQLAERVAPLLVSAGWIPVRSN